MNNIHDVRCDIDRLKYYQSKGNEDKVSDYSRLLVEHTKNMLDNFQEKEFETKNIITQEVLNKMSDHSAAMLLREILFDKDNIVDWDKAFCLIHKYMPELRVMD